MRDKQHHTPPADALQKQVDKKSLQKTTPCAIDAEQAVLGAILLDNTAIFAALEVMSSDDFHRPSHRTIFEAMLAIISRQETCDLLKLRDELTKMQQLDRVGGPAYLAALVDQIPTAANITSHAKIVAEKATAYRLLHTSLEIAARCYEEHEDADDLIQTATQKVFAIAERRQKGHADHVAEKAGDLMRYLEYRHDHAGEILGLPSGWHDLDRRIGGFEPGNVITIAAWIGEGKTSVACGIALFNSLLNKRPGLYFSLEMTTMELMLRLVCMHTRLNYSDIKQGYVRNDEWQHLNAVCEMFAQSPLYIDETPETSALDIRAKARHHKLQHDIQYIVVDHLGLISRPSFAENRTQAVAYNSRQMKIMAKELNIPVFSLCQLRKSSQDNAGGRPETSDLKDSGAPAEDSDVILFPYRPEHHGIPGTEGLAEMIIGKQRNGPIGTVHMAFLKECAKYESLAAAYPEERTF